MGEMFYAIFTRLTSEFVKRALLGAGLGLTSYTGMTKVMEKMIQDAQAEISSGDAFALGMVGLTGIDVAISIILSACVMRMTMTSASLSLTAINRD